MELDRRRMIAITLAATGACSFSQAPAAAMTSQRLPYAPKAGPRARVILVNDLSGDVDGLFAAAHMLLSPSIELRAIIGTATRARGETAEASVALAHELLRLTNRDGKVPVYMGAEGKLTAPGAAIPSPGTQAIMAEAMRDDTALPLYVAVGGGLTEVASALMLAPSIAERLTLIWIGGSLSPAPHEPEYNFGIDPLAAQYVFNEATVPIWQVPREAYASCLVSNTEVQAFIEPYGEIGRWLYEKLLAANAKMGAFSMNTGETWTMGDNPLVLLTALTDWVPSQFGRQPKYERTGSSIFLETTAPLLDSKGSAQARNDGRKIRIYQNIDVRIMLSDLYAKLRIQASRSGILD